MAKPKLSKEKIVKCACCGEPLTTFMAYIPDKGEVCLKCFAEYAQAEENLLVTRSKEQIVKKIDVDK
jgi:recombinational DNA repair protein (RecF pathway)